MGELPVLDRTVQRVLELCRDEDYSTAELVATLEGDAEFAANLLRFANSAYASRPLRVRTIRQAVMMAGRLTISRMAVEAATWRFLERAPGNGRASVGLMHVHAVAVASWSLELAQRSGAAAEVAHLAGLLHDIGKLVMPLAFGEQELDAIAAHAPAGRARVDLEHLHCGCDHALAGAMLARASRVDAPVVTAILAHHDLDGDASAETACVQVANELVGMLMGIEPDRPLLARALRALGMQAGDLDDIAAQAVPFGVGPTLFAPASTSLAGRSAKLSDQRAHTDELTGLANRRNWQRQARELVRTKGGAVMICNLDHFKQLNDQSGHLTGDLVISEVARILSHHGFAGRLGGDELVLLAAVAPTQARTVAETIRKQVRQAFRCGSIDGWKASVSIGVALADGDQLDLDALLTAADDALDKAKRAGRGRVVVAD
ncbi:MAG: HDOD domain-containing protein [Solirubrobacteraceae bacterium]